MATDVGVEVEADNESPQQQQQQQQHESRSGNTGDATPPAAREEHGMALEELLYSSSSFHAIVKPVTVTMILTALTVVYVNTEESIQEGEQALNSYVAFTSDDSSSTARNVGLSLLNALIMVCVIGLMTFVIVLLYKYR